MIFSKRNWQENGWLYFWSILIFSAFGLFVFYPLAKAFRLAFGEHEFSLRYFESIFKSHHDLGSLTNSVVLAAIVASAAVSIGYAFAYLQYRTFFRGKKLLHFLTVLPMVSPPFVLTLSLILLFGRNGLITNRLLNLSEFSIYGLGGLSVVQTLCFFPLAYLTLSGVLQAIDSTLENAALNLGASPWSVFWKITFRLSAPGIAAAWLLVFSSSIADFANPQMLGGDFHVLSTEVYTEMTSGGSFGRASALSLFMLLPCLIAFLLQRSFIARANVTTITGKAAGRFRENISPLAKRLLIAFITFVMAFALLLYGTLIVGAFTVNWGIDFNPSIRHFNYAWQVGSDAYVDTLILSLISAPIAAFLGIFAAYISKALAASTGKNHAAILFESLALLPLGVPGTLIGISYILAFNSGWIVLTQTAAILVLSFVFRHSSLGLEAAKASFKQMDKSLEEAAINLGASRFGVFFRVFLPLLRPAFFSALAYVFVHCMTAVSAIIFLVSPHWKHLTVQILNQTEYFQYSVAATMCLVLVVTIMLVLSVLRVFVGKSPLASGAEG